MSESAKTMAFVAVALVALLAGWATRPAPAKLDVDSLIGADLTKGFTDPGEAKRLKIVEFDEDSATLREFEVAEEDGLWTIPSKSGYPADAKRQMAEAATSLMNREILAVASESAADHEQYGVIDPQSPKLEAGLKGVGTRVTISDIQEKPLADLVIGHEVKDAANAQHYVREANRDVVYVVELDPTRLSTDFEDWIEKDLLKLNAWDIQDVQINDYSAELQPVMTPQGLAVQVAWDPRSELKLAYNESESKWTPVELKEFNQDAKNYSEFKLGDDEELNAEKLDALKTALDDLAIVDVDKKPAGLSAGLKAGTDFLNDPEARKDLRSLGFAAIPARSGEGQEIISSEGEVIVTMKDGVEYVLRFGDLRMDASAKDADQSPDATAAEKAKAGDKNVQRYLFAMARFNENAVKKPELEELPTLPESKTAETPQADSATPVEEEEEEEETNESAEASSLQRAEAIEVPNKAQADEQSPEVEKLIAVRKQIESENQRKLDEYQALLEKGRQEVKDLNVRFGDWYFVVSNDTFQKIRLGRNDVVKKKDDTGEGASADGLNSAAGAPGTALPGLPSLPGAGQ